MIVLMTFLVEGLTLYCGIGLMKHIQDRDPGKLPEKPRRVFREMTFQGGFVGEETFQRKLRESSQIQHILAVGDINWANFSCQHCIQELPQQLSNFNIDEAKCYCCSNNHVTLLNYGGWTMDGEQKKRT